MKIAHVLLLLMVIVPAIMEVEGQGNPFNAEVYLPFESITGDTVPGGTLDGQLLDGTSASIEPAVLGNGLVVSQTALTIGNRRDSCFWLPDLCAEGLTFAVWIRLGSRADSYMYLMSNGGQTHDSYGMALLMKNQQLMAMIRTSINSYVSVIDTETTVTSTAGQFFHVAVTWNKSTNETKLYVNGTLKVTSEFERKDTIKPQSEHNEFIFGGSNRLGSYKHSDAVIDEYLFWPEIKDSNFIKSVFQRYSIEFKSIRLMSGERPFLPMDLMLLIDLSNDTCLQLRDVNQLSHPSVYKQYRPILRIRLPTSMLDDLMDPFRVTLTAIGDWVGTHLGINESGNQLNHGILMKMCYLQDSQEAGDFSTVTYECTGTPAYIYLTFPSNLLCDIKFHS